MSAMLHLSEVELKQQVEAIRRTLDHCNQISRSYTATMPLIRTAIEAAGEKARRARLRQAAACQRYDELLTRMDRLALQFRDDYTS